MIPHGSGRMVFENGDEYDGEWALGKMTGMGEFKWTMDGLKYEGRFLNGKRHGRGKSTDPDGITDEGDWNAD